MKNIKILLSIGMALAISFGTNNIASAHQDPMFVTITSDGCATCQKLKPTVDDLENEYGGQITFITLDVSSRNLLEEAKQIAENNGISNFFDNNKSAVPMVGILCPGGKVEKTFLGETRKEVYEQALNKLLEDTNQLCSL